MDSAQPSGSPLPLDELRRQLADLDPTLGPRFVEAIPPLRLGAAMVDTALAGGLSRAALHDLAPADPIHLGAASGFALAVAARAAGRQGKVLWIATDQAGSEGGLPYGPGLNGFGLKSANLLLLQVAKPVDALWAMEEGLRCRALACVVAEFSGAEADLTATRRLGLAARAGLGLGLLLRHAADPAPSAAATRWQIAAALSRPDRFGGLGRPAFDLTLLRNRRGTTGRWTVTWDAHERTFAPAVSLPVAAAAVDRPARTPAIHAG